LLGALQKRHPSMDARAIEDAIFMDVHGIGAGRSFASVIEDKVRNALVVIAVIGPRWHGRGRLWRARIHQATDWVRRELELAYTLPIAILPVRVDGAQPLRAEDLPASLRYLATLQTPDLRHDRWGVDVTDFVESAIAASASVRVAPHAFVGQKNDLKPTGGRPALRWVLGVGFLALFAGGWLVWKPTEANPTIVATSPTTSATTTSSTPAPAAAASATRYTKTADGMPVVGYDLEFLGEGHRVPLPKPGAQLAADAWDGGAPIDYLHYSLVMHQQRSLALFAAVNSDRVKYLKLARQADEFRIDVRLPRGIQRDDGLYTQNEWDRGHLVRRALVSWQDERVEDTTWFQRAVSYYPATAPQHSTFNQTTWGHLEDYVQWGFEPEAKRVIVFAGPVFGDKDPSYRSTRIPASFWMLVVAVDDKNKNLLKVGAFRARQLALAADGTPKIGTDGLPLAMGRTVKEEFAPQKYAIAVTALSKLTGLDFGYLAQYDVTGR